MPGFVWGMAGAVAATAPIVFLAVRTGWRGPSFWTAFYVAGILGIIIAQGVLMPN